jgi:nucleotide-binding universal stress UspA family protein
MPSAIRKICVPTDFSEASDRAVTYAAALARGFGASLYLVHVLKDHTEYHAARTALARIAATRAGNAACLATEVRMGDPAECIRDAARHYGADLIVMATRGRTGLSHAISGSVTEDVIRTAWCPVLVLRDSGTVRVHRGSATAVQGTGRLAGIA